MSSGTPPHAYRRFPEPPMRLNLATLLIPIVMSIFSGETQAQVPVSADSLLCLTSGQLEALYRQSIATAIPSGPIRGTALLRPGQPGAARRARLARFAWQGKVFRDDATVVNRFFGLRAIEARVCLGPSQLDGGPSLILDYHDTSHLYARNRDEIRQVAPGLWLGLMYEDGNPQPVLMFALEAR
ncbi:MAG TPA: hypothetical protein VFT74_05675 [Isosphaeraceae bacterium]|nr:hypothetical protein [Isosphaeraceae bacterium]